MKTKTMKKILQTVLKHHLIDAKNSKEDCVELLGLCSVARWSLSISDKNLFREYLQKNVDIRITKHAWSTHNENTERKEWLIKHINLN